MTNHDEKGAAETELLHRYVDGDLTVSEREALERRAATDPTIAARIEGLLEIRALVSETAAKASEGLDSDALFARIEGAIAESTTSAETSSEGATVSGESGVISGEGDAVSAPRKRPDLRVLPGGASPRSVAPAVPADVRQRRIIGAIIGALAVAAAAAIVFTQSGPGEPEVAVNEPAVDPETVPAPELNAVAEAEGNRTEVLEVDFGTNVGTIFAVEGDEGQRYAVVWLDDAGDVSASAND